MGIFNKDHYPTPIEVIKIMCEGLILHDKHVLEPSVGSGNIVDYLIDEGANVIGCEIDDDIRAISSTKCHIIEHDFLNVKSEQISHVDYIIMNPPFSADEKHILHAWKIAPDGCVIISLCNYETLHNDFSKKRKELTTLIKEYGKWTDMDKAFAGSERSTKVSVAMVKLTKPGEKGGDEFDGFILTEDEEVQFDGIQKYNFVRDVVNRYIGSIKIFDKQIELGLQMSDMNRGYFGKGVTVSHTFEQSDVTLTRETYKKELQKSAWTWVIGKFNLEKYVTKDVKDDINKFVETQTKVPFTMRNIYRMIEILVGTAGHRMDKTMLKVFDDLTRHYSENRYSVEGFKTNSNYLVNEKFIFTHIFGESYPSHNQLCMSYSNGNAEVLEDFIKALCFITGKNYDMSPTLYEYLRHTHTVRYPDGTFLMEKSKHHEGNFNVVGLSDIRMSENQIQEFKDKYISQGFIIDQRPDWGKWFDFGFFEIKGYKKGTGHIRFKDRDVWATFNQHIARIKGFPLPDIKDSGSQKRTDNDRKKKNGKS